MYCRWDWEQPLKVDLVVIREVILPQHLKYNSSGEAMDESEEHEPYIGQVWVNALRSGKRKWGEYRASRERTQCSWTCLLGHVDDCGIIIGYNSEDRVSIC